MDRMNLNGTARPAPAAPTYRREATPIHQHWGWGAGVLGLLLIVGLICFAYSSGKAAAPAAAPTETAPPTPPAKAPEPSINRGIRTGDIHNGSGTVNVINGPVSHNTTNVTNTTVVQQTTVVKVIERPVVTERVVVKERVVTVPVKVSTPRPARTDCEVERAKHNARVAVWQSAFTN